jgi:hypothetical protein
MAAIREIVPGLFHWTAVHPKIRIEVSSYWLEPAGVLLDPLEPAEGLEWFRGRSTAPQHVVLTNRHHWRHTSAFQEAFGCTAWCNAEGMHEFTHGERVQPFRAGEVLPGGVETHEVGVLCPDETALRLPVEGGALACADGVVRDGDGPLAFVPDPLLGDDPEAVKRAPRTRACSPWSSTTCCSPMASPGSAVHARRCAPSQWARARRSGATAWGSSRSGRRAPTMRSR